MSLNWPGVRMKRSGFPKASTRAWSWVLIPPRERPIARASAPLFCPPHVDAYGRWWIDHDVFKVRGIRHGSKKPVPDPVLRPARKADEDAVPVAEKSWQIAPWRASACQPEHRFHKQPVIRTRPAGITALARQMRLHSRPLMIF